MNKFATNQCPMCGKMLKLRVASGVSTYSCPTQDAALSQSHYEVEMDNRNVAIQHMILFPYSIDNYGNNSKSRIYQHNANGRWSFVKEVSQIRADTEAHVAFHLEKFVSS